MSTELPASLKRPCEVEESSREMVQRPKKVPSTTSPMFTSREPSHTKGNQDRSSSSSSSSLDGARASAAPPSAFSCERCAKRKVKCDKLQPRCTACVRHGTECIPSQSTQSDKPRKKRFPEAELLHKIDAYERAFRQMGLDPDEVRGGKANLSLVSPASSSTHHHHQHQRASARDTSPSTVDEEYRQASIILMHHHTIKGDPASRDSKHLAPPASTAQILNILDEVWHEDGSLTMFFAPGQPEDPIPPVHPSPLETFKLWQNYLDHFHPLFKIVHAPSLQKKIFEMVAYLGGGGYGSNSEGVRNMKPPFTPSDQALLYAIYTAAVTFVHPEDFEGTFGSERAQSEWIAELRKGTRYWLYYCNVFRTSDMQVVQALLIFLNVLGAAVDPRTMASFAGLVDRLARRIGLHRERCGFSNGTEWNPFDAEMRRRVWWEVVSLDARSLEKAGLGANGLDNNWRVKFPSPVGDADLDTKSKLPDSESSSPSTPSPEMMFFIIRCEITAFLHERRLDQGRDVGWTEFSSPHQTLAEKLSSLDEFEVLLNEKYLVHCDPAHALQRLCICFVKASLVKMRVSAYISEESLQARHSNSCNDASRGKGGSSGRRANATVSTTTLRNDMLTLCTSAVSNASEILSDAGLRRYHCFIHVHKPFVAVIHLLRLLCEHTEGEAVERAWKTLDQASGLFQPPKWTYLDKAPGRVKQLLYPMLSAAWEARRNAKGVWSLEEPDWIRQIWERERNGGGGGGGGATDLNGKMGRSGSLPHQHQQQQGMGTSGSILQSCDDLMKSQPNSSLTGNPASRELAVAQTLASQMVERNDLSHGSNGRNHINKVHSGHTYNGSGGGLGGAGCSGSQSSGMFLPPFEEEIIDPPTVNTTLTTTSSGPDTSPSTAATTAASTVSGIDFDWEEWFQSSLLGGGEMEGENALLL